MSRPSRRALLGTAGAIGAGAALGGAAPAGALARSRERAPAYDTARADDTAPARAALARLLPRHADQFQLVPLAPDGDADRFRVDGPDGPDHGLRDHPRGAADRRALVPQVHLPGPSVVGRRPAGAAGPAARPGRPRGAGHLSAAPLRPQRHPRRLHRPVRGLAALGADDRCAGAARGERGAGHPGLRGRLPPAADRLRLLRRRGPRLAPGALAPAVVAAAEHERLRRPAQPPN